MRVRRDTVFAVLTTISLAMILFTMVPTRSLPSGLPYDPWMDINDDGQIDMKDIGNVAARFMTTGEPINKTALIGSTVSYYQWSGGGHLSSSEAVLCSQIFTLSKGGKIEVYGGAFYWSQSAGNRYVSNLRIYLNDTLKSAQNTGVLGSAFYGLSVTHSELLASGNYTVQLGDIATEWTGHPVTADNVDRQVYTWTIVITSFAA